MSRSTKSVHNCVNGSHGTMLCVRCGLKVSTGDYGLWTSNEGEFSVAHRRCAPNDFRFDAFDKSREDNLASLKKALERYTKAYEEFGYSEAYSDMARVESQISQYEEEISEKLGDKEADEEASIRLFKFKFTVKLKDCEPSRWPVKYPFWFYGTGLEATVVAYGENLGYVMDLWPLAENVSAVPEDFVTYTSRFKRPAWLDDFAYAQEFGSESIKKWEIDR